LNAPLPDEFDEVRCSSSVTLPSSFTVRYELLPLDDDWLFRSPSLLLLK
jgi:hypothetical protein